MRSPVPLLVALVTACAGKQDAGAPPHPPKSAAAIELERYLSVAGRVYWRDDGLCIEWTITPKPGPYAYPHGVGRLRREYEQDGFRVSEGYPYVATADGVTLFGPHWTVFDGRNIGSGMGCAVELPVTAADEDSFTVGDETWFRTEAACQRSLHAVASDFPRCRTPERAGS